MQRTGDKDRFPTDISSEFQQEVSLWEEGVEGGERVCVEEGSGEGGRVCVGKGLEGGGRGVISTHHPRLERHNCFGIATTL